MDRIALKDQAEEKSAKARRMSTEPVGEGDDAPGPVTIDLAAELPPSPPPQQAEALCHSIEALLTSNRNNGRRAGNRGCSFMYAALF